VGIVGHKVQRESDLYPIIKNSFKKDGYTVFAEVAVDGRGVDVVAQKDDEHIAIELKMSFNGDVVWQARLATGHFDKVYIAFPVSKIRIFNSLEVYHNLKESIRRRYDQCEALGIGIMQVLPSGLIFEALEPKQQTPYRKVDLQHYIESDDDLGGVPNQKGVSEGYHELESIKKYVTEHPTASWKEIYANVSNHYSSHTSMAGAMRQWRGFVLSDFRIRVLPVVEDEPEQASLV
jgi:hypothetical protein